MPCGVGLVGPAAELNAAYKLGTVGRGGGILVPWRMLECPEHRAAPEPRGEARAFTTTAALDGGTMAYADYAGAHALAVDGIHASMETEVSSVADRHGFLRARGERVSGGIGRVGTAVRR